ncbi:MAG: hypothetical protein IJA81_03170 [Akkermansia sp.]|nr:hypothetical protein [Akkermansia sp.]
MNTTYEITVNFRIDSEDREIYQEIYDCLGSTLKELDFISADATSTFVLYSTKTSGDKVRQLLARRLKSCLLNENIYDYLVIIMTERIRTKTVEEKFRSSYNIFSLNEKYKWYKYTFKEYYYLFSE